MTKERFRVARCALDGVEAVEADTARSFARHTHDRYGIGVIERGAHRSLSGRGVVEAGPGQTITVNPGEVHDGAPIGDAGRSWRMLYVDPALVATVIDDASDGAGDDFEFPQPVMADPRMTEAVRRLIATLADRPAAEAELAAQEQMLALFASLAGIIRSRSGREHVAPALRHARALIDSDPAAPLSLTDLAQAAGLSRFQVLRGFVRATGLTPHAYLVQRRVQLARRLIAGGHALAEAAAASGFADQSHMTRVFVRAYGLSPGIYAAALS
ncbi:MAG TPA: AraC family transcriptional regulator [Microvirga sp.]|jgi:AraC-like DNA-binding protein|nr:AraC family transcriptional regulator [Microvirga sp.]